MRLARVALGCFGLSLCLCLLSYPRAASRHWQMHGETSSCLERRQQSLSWSWGLGEGAAGGGEIKNILAAGFSPALRALKCSRAASD